MAWIFQNLHYAQRLNNNEQLTDYTVLITFDKKLKYDRLF